MEENHHRHYLRPLLSPSTTTTAITPPLDDHEYTNNHILISSHSSIIFRLSLVAFIGIVSIWANHEASKGYAITIVNDSGQTLPGKRFQLFYVSNDEATRIILEASNVIQSFLYSNNENPTKKKVEHVILKLASRVLVDNVIVDTVADQNEFVLNISPSIMERTNFDEAIIRAIREGVALVWLWDGQGNAPKNLINGIVEYIILMLYNLGDRWAVVSPDHRAEPPDSVVVCWKHDDPRWVAGFLSYCERRRPGFIRRLNRALKDRWDDGILDGVLGRSIQSMCTSYHESLRYNIYF
ncbi:hypothetical protein CASFOL_002149 [Castilleja foliolosa]|uniref:Uncharacterized protein n=1 Tax=Castilleja foliolosa TaxID=1961234 RepID=A0ABD3EDF5_9LAMI